MKLTIFIILFFVSTFSCINKEKLTFDKVEVMDKNDSEYDSEVDNQNNNVESQFSDKFEFIVMGDFNEGGCDRNDRVKRLMDLIIENEIKTAAFFISTGDLIDGYGTNSCFAADPASVDPEWGCPDKIDGRSVPNGNIKEMMGAIISRKPMVGLKASFYPTIGNHDSNAEWYPGPCNTGICDLVAPVKATDYITRTINFNSKFNSAEEAICDKTDGDRTYPEQFYYSFGYKNSHFIVLNQSQDHSGMLNCNQHPGYDNCTDYCASEEESRSRYCHSGYTQFDWLRTELKKVSEEGKHIFVFEHAPLMTSNYRHRATQGAKQIRNLLEKYKVDILFNGHNHAYERTHPIRGGESGGADATVGEIVNDGVTYITVGSAGGGSSDDNVQGSWFTANSYHSWNNSPSWHKDWQDKLSVYLKITVDGKKISGRVYSIGNFGSDTDSDGVLYKDKLDHFSMAK